MIGFIPERKQMWSLGVAAGLLIFFMFLLLMAMTRHNTLTYPQDDIGLRSFHSDQCERPADKGWLVEVQNTLSNCGYALAGAFILLRARSWAGHLLGINLVVLAIMSGLYHATLTYDEQILDVVWVYAALLSLSVYAAFVHTQANQAFWLPWWAWLAFGIAWVLLALILLLAFDLKAVVALSILTAFIAVAELLCFLARDLEWFGWIVGGALLAGIPILGYLMRKPLGWDSDAVFAILAALLILQLFLVFVSFRPDDVWRVTWQLGIVALALGGGLFYRLFDGYASKDDVVTRKLLCLPDSAFQAHAHWHLLSAAALLLSYDILAQAKKRQPGLPADKPVIFAE